MPKYVYQGLNSGVTFELEQRISEAALTHHPETGEPVKRLIGRPAIAFKGSGFYATDARSSSSGGESKSESKAENTSSTTATTTSSESSASAAPSTTSSDA
jgi:predicted nucleic acid-binding Zn ribbon protein